MLFETLQSLYY